MHSFNRSFFLATIEWCLHIVHSIKGSDLAAIAMLMLIVPLSLLNRKDWTTLCPCPCLRTRRSSSPRLTKLLCLCPCLGARRSRTRQPCPTVRVHHDGPGLVGRVCVHALALDVHHDGPGLGGCVRVLVAGEVSALLHTPGKGQAALSKADTLHF